MSKTKEIDQDLLLFASVIITELEGDDVLKKEFWNSFHSMFLELDEDVQKQLKLLISAISMLSLVYTFQAFNKLDYTKRQNYISRLFNFPFSKFVSGLTGLRSLCLFAFYTQKEQWQKINYDGPA